MPEQESQAHSELASFGEELRREREIRGISLKEIADATKVSKRFLEAIERNDHKTLPAPVFTRGFVREYARYLGLNADEMVNRYNYGVAGDDRIEKSPQLERLARLDQEREIVPVERPPRPRRDIPPTFARLNVRALAGLLVIAALGALVYWSVMRKRQAENEATKAAVAAAAPAAPRSNAVQPPATATSDSAAAAVSATGAPLHLTINFRQNSWVSLEADGKQVLSDEIKRGETRTFEAKDGFRFKTIGNAAGVELTLNGSQLPPLGGEGEVVKDYVVDRSALQHPQQHREGPTP